MFCALAAISGKQKGNNNNKGARSSPYIHSTRLLVLDRRERARSVPVHYYCVCIEEQSHARGNDSRSASTSPIGGTLYSLLFLFIFDEDLFFFYILNWAIIDGSGRDRSIYGSGQLWLEASFFVSLFITSHRTQFISCPECQSADGLFLVF